MIKTNLTLDDGSLTVGYYLDESSKKKLDYLFSLNVASDARLQIAFDQINKLRDELVSEIFVPKMQAAIVEALRVRNLKEADVRKACVTDKSELTWVGYWRAWQGYEKAHVVVPISQGKGRARLWHLSIRPETQLEAK
jgi:hypothetical protein